MSSANSRDLLIDAATRLFGAHGFRGASTRDIAHLAGVRQGLIRYHFGGKEGLWREVITDGLGQLAARLAVSEEAPPVAGAPTAWLEAGGARGWDLGRSVLHELLSGPGERRRWLVAQLRPLYAVARDGLSAERRGIGVPLSDVQVVSWLAAAVCGPLALSAAEDLLERPLSARDRAAQREFLSRWLAAEGPEAGSWSIPAARRRRLARPASNDGAD